MKLQLKIKKEGEVFTLLPKSEPLEQEMIVVKEDEIIQFELEVSNTYSSAVLELYQHSIPVTKISYPFGNQDNVLFTWAPENGSNSTTSKLFWNYFGVAELTVILMDERGEVADLIEFQGVQVVAVKSQADKVEKMFEYLARVSPETLYSVFSASRHSVGFEEGHISPNHIFEQLEYALSVLQKVLPHILRNPLTRLVPEHRLTPVNGQEELDDTSIGWLLENLSVLEPTDRSDESHLCYEGDYYKANTLLLPTLEEVSDIYENWIIHGFIELLIHTANNLSNRIWREIEQTSPTSKVPPGYVSFFEKMTKFKSLLMDAHLQKIDTAILTLKQYKFLLDKELPVNRVVNQRPLITPKIINQQAYRHLFTEIIRWHEKGEVDWSAYQHLFAIESIPVLFEAYAYLRVLESVNRYLVEDPQEQTEFFKKDFVDGYANEIIVIREPTYWAVEHRNQHLEGLMNSEAYTVSWQEIRARGQQGVNSKRVPDIVIQIKQANGIVKLIVIDAKYSYADKSFRDYLPSLTMKYVHGIHRLGQKESLVDSLVILYPDDSGMYRDYHHGIFGVFGEQAVVPSLLCCGVVLDESRQVDFLDRLVRRILEIQGVKPLKESVVSLH